MDRLTHTVYEFARTSLEPVTARTIRQFLTLKRGPLVAHVSPRDLTIRLSRILYEGTRDGYLVKIQGYHEERVYTGRAPIIYLPGRAA